MMGLTRNGKFPSGNYFGQTRLAPFHEWERQVPQSSKDRLNFIEKGLEDGSIKTGIPWLVNSSSTQNP
jgi:basic membrane protein A